MGAVRNASLSERLVKGRAVNSTDASLPARPVTLTKPTGDGVVNPFVAADQFVPTHVKLFPIGTGIDNSTFTARLVGFRLIGSTWVPFTLWQGTCTLSAFTGVAGGAVLDTERFADEIVTTVGVEGVTCQAVSPKDNTPAHVLIDAKGCPLYEPVFALNGSATAANCLIASV